MAIKALKQNVSICEIQKMIHQWKNRGINDPTVTKPTGPLVKMARKI